METYTITYTIRVLDVDPSAILEGAELAGDALISALDANGVTAVVTDEGPSVTEVTS